MHSQFFCFPQLFHVCLFHPSSSLYQAGVSHSPHPARPHMGLGLSRGNARRRAAGRSQKCAKYGVQGCDYGCTQAFLADLPSCDSQRGSPHPSLTVWLAPCSCLTIVWSRRIDCLVKTKHHEAGADHGADTISAQCSESQSEEIQ